MKYFLVLLTLFAVVAAYLYWRLRPYIKVARQVFGAARGASRIDNHPIHEDSMHPAATRAGENLVRCASCDTWLPASRALAVGKSGVQFCSHECLERATNDPARARQSAS